MKRTLSIVTSLAIGLLLTQAPSPASATGTESNGADDTVVTVAEAATALTVVNDANDAAVPRAAASSSDADSAALSRAKDGTTIDVPRDAADGVSLTAKDGKTFTVGLPGGSDAGAADKLENGIVVYPSNDGFANVVAPRPTGVQLLTTITGSESPDRYTYELDIPNGGELRLTDEGSAVVYDGHGALVQTIDRPYARDAAGNPVSTHFSVSGSTLTQHVAHRADTTAYPVVADPSFWSGMGNFAACIFGVGVPIGAGIALAMYLGPAGLYVWVTRGTVNLRPGTAPGLGYIALQAAKAYGRVVYNSCRKAILA